MNEQKIHECLRCGSTEFDLVEDESGVQAVCRQCLLVAYCCPPKGSANDK